MQATILSLSFFFSLSHSLSRSIAYAASCEGIKKMFMEENRGSDMRKIYALLAFREKRFSLSLPLSLSLSLSQDGHVWEMQLNEFLLLFLSNIDECGFKEKLTCMGIHIELE
jgi:hypothetical protein